MKSPHENTLLTADAADAVSSVLAREERFEARLFERYLGFLGREGFDARQMAVATGGDVEDDRDGLMHGLVISGIAAAILILVTLAFLSPERHDPDRIERTPIVDSDSGASLVSADAERTGVFPRA